MTDRPTIRETLAGDGSTKGEPPAFEDLGFAKIDHQRLKRKGFAEVVYCQGKTPDQVASIVSRLAEQNPQVLCTRAGMAHYEAARESLGELCYDETAGVLWLDREPDRDRLPGVLIVVAGTSDLPVAKEAQITLDVMGHRAEVICDVGVAGLHRLTSHLSELEQANVVITIAGMDGALPSVVAGLVAAPVVAVPTSVGYGASFDGLAALLSMLNACAPGLAVVNIDNGHGAGVYAAIINERIHAAARGASGEIRQRNIT